MEKKTLVWLELILGPILTKKVVNKILLLEEEPLVKLLKIFLPLPKKTVENILFGLLKIVRP